MQGACRLAASDIVIITTIIDIIVITVIITVLLVCFIIVIIIIMIIIMMIITVSIVSMLIIKCKASRDGAVGWFTLRSSDGSTSAQASRSVTLLVLGIVIVDISIHIDTIIPIPIIPIPNIIIIIIIVIFDIFLGTMHTYAYTCTHTRADRSCAGRRRCLYEDQGAGAARQLWPQLERSLAILNLAIRAARSATRCHIGAGGLRTLRSFSGNGADTKMSLNERFAIAKRALVAEFRLLSDSLHCARASRGLHSDRSIIIVVQH